MEFLKKLLLLSALVIVASNAWAGKTCAPFLAEKSSDKLISAIELLNPEILSGSKSPEQLYIDLKTEEASWIKSNGYIDYNRKLSEEQKQRILDHYKVNKETLVSDYDFSLFYMNQVRLLYIRVSNFVYQRILSASLGSVVTPRINEYAKSVINSFFVYDLNSVELTPERFKETIKNAPWLMFPWSEATAIFTAWESQPIKGPRELDRFMFDMKEQYAGKIKPEHLDKILQSLRTRDAVKEVCCKTGLGCQNCPLNRRFLL